jgi:hypothetical protein
LSLVVDDAVVAGWNNEGLPSDRMSTENATILTTCERWPLMIDPQLQGRNRFFLMIRKISCEFIQVLNGSNNVMVNV